MDFDPMLQLTGIIDEPFDLLQLTGLTANPEPSPEMKIRSLVSTKEAGIIIGKAGQYISHIRDMTGIHIGISPVIDGCSERALSMEGPLLNISKAFSLIAQAIQDTLIFPPHKTPSVRLIVAHRLIGSVIGKGGARIKETQDKSDSRIVIAKEMLPESNERVIEIFGSANSMYLFLKLDNWPFTTLVSL
jgi:heterogeneous nuclear rnp K-like protein 2